MIVLDRGSCAFTTKALHAQNAGADAVLIVDNVEEDLVTMDASSDDTSVAEASNVTVPVGLVTEATGELIEPVLTSDQSTVLVTLNWTDVLPHPDARVEWELWSNSGDNCGAKCDAQKGFIRDFASAAKALEQGGYTQFTPHYITWLCPPESVQEEFCVKQCINNGRYCCPDPDDDFDAGFSGADVVVQNLRTLCVFREANATAQPWKWWDYVTEFERKCTMALGTFNDVSCAEAILFGLNLDASAVRACVGDPAANEENPVLEHEMMSQLDDGQRGDITLLPTVVINERQYRGKLTREAVLRTLCAGFGEGQKPELCSSEGAFENKCAEDNEGALDCARDQFGVGMTGCEVTNETPFYQCVCPPGSKLVGEKCEVTNGCVAAVVDTPACSCERCVCQDKGAGRIDCHEEPESACNSSDEHPGGCWRSGAFSACVDQIDLKKSQGMAGVDPDTVQATRCACPPGFAGDGLACADVDECATTCKGEHMTCKNTFGGYECVCEPGFGRVEDTSSPDGMTCLRGGGGFGGGTVAVAVLASCAIVAGGGFLVYRWRLRSYMNQEIKAIMAQYMPLEDGEAAPGPLAPHGHGDSDDEEANDLGRRLEARAP